MTDAQANQMIGSLRTLIKLFSLQLTQSMNAKDAILLLDKAGIDRNTIAEVCSTTPNTVSVRLSEAKKQKDKAAKHKEVVDDAIETVAQ